jgi:predicted nucleic acid-binding protein
MEKFVLDTNVISELHKRNPNKGCITWMKSVPFDHLYLTTITLSEIVQDIALNNQAHEKAELQAWLDEQLIPQFGERLLPFDQSAARIFGHLAAEAKRKRKTPPLLDTMIAATAIAHEATVVTRNKVDFVGLGVRVVNPWG